MRFGAIMLISTLCVLFSLFRHVVLLDFSAANRDNYGPYQAIYHHYEECRGPKMKNLTLFKTVLENDGKTYGARFNFTFFASTRFDEIKISVYTIKEGNKQTQLWNYKFDSPCQHLVMGALMEAKFKAKHCVVKKGFYTMYINFTELCRDFFGNSFFYGEFLFKVIILAKNGNIGCLNFYTDFRKA